jgi:group I intron endonuclease
MTSGIYKITNLNDNKVYIGSSINVTKRQYKHFWMLRNNKHDNLHLQNSFNKFGESSFLFEVIQFCGVNNLVSLENNYIIEYKSNDSNYGYNLAKVNEFRRNTYNDEVKLKLSLYNKNKNGNINKFTLTEINGCVSNTFDNLFEAARYLINRGFTTGSERNVRQKLSNALRGKIIKNDYNGTIRKTIYKHKFETIN